VTVAVDPDTFELNALLTPIVEAGYASGHDRDSADVSTALQSNRRSSR
jgi:hypothetical protein